MKRRLLFLLILLAGCRGSGPGAPTSGPATPPATPRLGGTDFGGGSDTGPSLVSEHWFPNARRISYCIKHGENFGVSREEAKAGIEAAFATWNSYLEEKVSDFIHLTLQPSYRECAPEIDLVFYLGTSSEEVERGKVRYGNPSAFAHKKGRQGLIWVAEHHGTVKTLGIPNWKRGENLKATLLHELGHVYGNGHIPGTIMAADLSQQLERMPTDLLTRIDHQRELYTCVSCQVSYTTFADEKDIEQSSDAANAYRQIMGEGPVGRVQFQLTRRLIHLYYAIRLKVSDASNSVTLEAQGDPAMGFAIFTSGLPVFQSRGDDGYLSYLENGGFEFRGTLAEPTGGLIGLGLSVGTTIGEDDLGSPAVRVWTIADRHRWNLIGFPSTSGTQDEDRPLE